MSTPLRAPRIPAAEARRRILEAAEALLARHRYRDLTVDLVMAEAGLTRTIFYRHFDGLPAVVLALLEQMGEQFEAVVEEPDRTLRSILEQVVDLYAAHGPLMRAVDEAARFDDAVEAAYRGLVDEHTERSAADLGGPEYRDVARALTLMNGTYLLETVARDPARHAAALAALLAVWEAVSPTHDC